MSTHHVCSGMTGSEEMDLEPVVARHTCLDTSQRGAISESKTSGFWVFLWRMSWAAREPWILFEDPAGDGVASPVHLWGFFFLLPSNLLLLF